LFVGPPGTGKTVLAEAFAKDAGVNFVRPLDIKSMWVGESEKRMSRFLNALRDLSPVVVFIDEFDQNQGQRGGFDGDSGVSRNLFKKMLEIMSDTSQRGKILWIFASNRPDLIDAAMKRPGRCDLRIPFLPPDQKMLSLICKAAFKQYTDMKSAIADFSPLVEKHWEKQDGFSGLDGYNGADMVEVIRRAWVFANESNRDAITEADFEAAVFDYRPQTPDKFEIATMTALAIQECSSKRLLPDGYKEVLKKCKEIIKNGPPNKFRQSPDIDGLLSRS